MSTIPEFLQTYGAWIAFAAFILFMKLLGSIGNKVWKHEHDTGEEQDDNDKNSSP